MGDLVFGMIYNPWRAIIQLVGTLVLAGDGERLRHLSFVNGRHPLHIEDDWRRDPAPFAGIKAQLADYFNGRRQAFDIALDPVWNAGDTVSAQGTLSLTVRAYSGVLVAATGLGD